MHLADFISIEQKQQEALNMRMEKNEKKLKDIIIKYNKMCM